MADQTTDDTEAFDEGNMDAIDLIQADAYERRNNAEATAKAFGAIESLTDVLARVRDDRCQIIDPATFVEQMRRLSQIAADYYAATGDA